MGVLAPLACLPGGHVLRVRELLGDGVELAIRARKLEKLGVPRVVAPRPPGSLASSQTRGAGGSRGGSLRSPDNRGGLA